MQLIFLPKKAIFDKQGFLVSHLECLGFAVCETDPLRIQQWQQLQYNNEIPWNRVQSRPLFYHDLNDALANNDMKFLRHCKIIHIYRNPLDQPLSYFKHVKKFPDLVTFISYEDLVNARSETFMKILSLLDIPLEPEAFNKALEVSSLDALKEFEEKSGRSLLSSDTKAPHIRNGGIGVWQEVMTPEMVQKIEATFNKFDLSLDFFQLAEVLQPQFAFLHKNKSSKFANCNPHPTI